MLTFVKKNVMTIFEISLICIFCIFQSIFGIGLLLLGTPSFILLGYSYFEVLNILLPYSIIISFLQIIVSKNNNYFFLKNIFFFSLPPLILGLIITSYIEKDFDYKYFIAFFLILTSLINLMKLKTNKIIFKNLKLSLFFLGVIHGLSNLGGGILSIIASSISKNKTEIRFYIASGYLIFAIVQLFIVNIFFQKINFTYLMFIWIPLLLFFLSNKFFNKISSPYYFYIMNFLICFYGLYLFVN